MAAKPEPKPRAMVDGQYMLDVDDALALVGLLTKAVRVERDWKSSGYKYDVSRNDQGVTIKLFSPADEAMLAMNSEPKDNQ